MSASSTAFITDFIVLRNFMLWNVFNFIFVSMELSKLSCINVTYMTGYNNVSVVNKMYLLNSMGVKRTWKKCVRHLLAQPVKSLSL
jgi:hypothetical protein